MITREQVKEPKNRILAACVKMFIERGFKATTMQDIIREADVSSGTFQNIFRTKDGVLFELTEFMFSNQFDIAHTLTEKSFTPACLYAVETAVQLAIAELNENLREIYIEAYTQPKLAEYIYQMTSTELRHMFEKYNPTWEDSDFYETEIGTAGMMRAFMARPCDKYFTLKRKTEKFVKMALAIFGVPQDEREEAISVINSIDITKTAQNVMEKLFFALEMNYEIKFSNREVLLK